MAKTKARKSSKTKKQKVKQRKAKASGRVTPVDKYWSPDDLHTYFDRDENVESLLCDACTARWERGEEVTMGEPTDELIAALMERWMVSEEGYAHMCQGHDHLVCEHILVRLWITSLGAAA